jgi:NADH-quinone oxidoreductase subunit J
MMELSTIGFYVIAAMMLVFGILSVTSRKIFRSAIWLLLTLVSIAALYFWMQMEFIAAIQIVVYVGGIVVLIIFSIFLTQQSGKEMPSTKMPRLISSALAALFGAAFIINILLHHSFGVTSDLVLDASVSKIGTQMLSLDKGGYILPFEAVSFLLLAAMVGCIVIAMKHNNKTGDA